MVALDSQRRMAQVQEGRQTEIPYQNIGFGRTYIHSGVLRVLFGINLSVVRQVSKHTCFRTSGGRSI